jgi:N-ethylmaleimide reductase
MMTSLFEPLAIGDLELKNRIAMAPMTRGRAGDTRVSNEIMAEYCLQRASAGRIITEATVVSPQGKTCLPRSSLHLGSTPETAIP